MSRKLEDLTDSFRKKVERFIKEHLDVGVKLVIIETYRSAEEQFALYAQGRKSLEDVNYLRKQAGLPSLSKYDNNHTVTEADGIHNKSKHQSRKACDIWYANKMGDPDWTVKDPVRIKSFGAIAKRLGMAWGGDFPPLDKDEIGWDANHVEDI
jgi:hypothetical protein